MMASKNDDSARSLVDIPKDLYTKYVSASQEQVFRFVENGVATPAEVSKLFAQLKTIDVSRVNRLYTASMSQKSFDGCELKPVSTVQVLAKAKSTQVEKWAKKGLEAIAASSVGVIVMAGGQGTRLGFDRPKGEYNIELPSGKSLFRLQAERIMKLELLAKKYGKSPKIFLYLMTSPMTHDPTVKAWNSEKFYGLSKDQVFFFQQGTLPCLTAEGKIMLESAGKVAMAPDGNGGIYLGLHASGALKHMKDNGVKSVFVGAIDNAVSKVADPTFVGYCILKKADVGNKVCTKCGPHEKVGVQCLRDGVPAVVEYSDIDSKIAELRDDDGNLVFSAGNVCIHYYSIDFLENTCHPSRLSEEFHVARKKIPYAHEKTGKTVPKADLKANTGIKLESFIFDVFTESKRLVVFEVERADEFSPVKNAKGSKTDSPDTARNIISSLHATWLKRAGVTLLGSGLCEISPMASYAGEGLEKLSGMSFSLPCLIQSSTERPPGDSAAFVKVCSTVPRGTAGCGLCVYSVKERRAGGGGFSQGCEATGCSML